MDYAKYDGKTKIIRLLKKEGGKTVLDTEKEVDFQSYRLTAEDVQELSSKADLTHFAVVRAKEEKKKSASDADTQITSDTEVKTGDYSDSLRAVEKKLTIILWGLEGVGLNRIAAADWQELVSVVKELDPLELKKEEKDKQKKIKELNENLNTSQKNKQEDLNN